LDAQRAIDLPNFASLGGAVVLEAGRFPPATGAALRALGHAVVERDLTSGLQAIERTPDGWFGGADPRREGVVIGD
ncbi:MAG: gamma-glutamyltransferase, partial [Burkholderiales bacterium]|nr:gamma-glutamyltransferase [Burkholderiales bacterium]